MIRFNWKRETLSTGEIQYRCTGYNEHNECVCQVVVYKGYNQRYGRVMYNFMSTYLPTLKEIKAYTEEMMSKPNSKNQKPRI